MRLAKYIVQCVKALEPHEKEVFELKPVSKRTEEENALPSVGIVLQPQSQMEEAGHNDLCYGWSCNRIVFTFMKPNEILDGAIILVASCRVLRSVLPMISKNFCMIKRHDTIVVDFSFKETTDCDPASQPVHSFVSPTVFISASSSTTKRAVKSVSGLPYAFSATTVTSTPKNLAV